jgi:glycosyltransferase involved in cell wall biosynthesis
MERKITAIITCYNEELNIAKAIESLLWADEILVVDSFSTDNTVSIIQNYPQVTLLQHKYENPSAQKNWVIPQAQNEWIVLLDADEWLTEPLTKEIKEVLKQDQIEEKAFWIGRDNKFMNTWVKYSGWQNDAVMRLFHRDFCQYQSVLVHEEIECQGKVGRLKNRIKHNTYKDFPTYFEKLDRYSTWRAKDKMKNPRNVSVLFHFILKPVFRFMKHYVIQFGFLDGRVGFIIASLNAYDVFLRGVKMWRIQKGEKFL